MKKFQVSHADKTTNIDAQSEIEAAGIAHKVFNAEHAIENADRLKFDHDKDDPDDHVVVVQSDGGRIAYQYWVYEVPE